MNGQLPLDPEALAILCDLLLPGSASGWPSASKAITELDAVFQQFDRDAADAITGWAMILPGLPAAERKSFLANRRNDDRHAFEQILIGLYRAYYGSKTVQDKIAVLAAAGPREMSPFVDADLVAGVVGHGRGMRRL